MRKQEAGKKKKKAPAAPPPPKSTFTSAANAGVLPGIFNALEGGTGGQKAGSPSSGGGTPSGGSGGDTGGSGSVDYSGLFYAFGMPPDMVKQINQAMAQYISSGMDETTAYDLIIGQIRGGQIGANFQNGQSWYDYTYSGISYGVANGLLDSSDPERSYRAYVNAINQYTQEYLGRAASTAEVLGYLQGGVDPSKVGAQLKGQSYANAYASGDSNAMGYSWNALLGAFGNLPNGEKQLSDQEKLALGESMTGYSTPMGDQLSKMLATAQRRMETIFRGTLATPADLQKGGSGLKAPSLAAEVTPDTGPI